MTVEQVKDLLKRCNCAYLASEPGEWIDAENNVKKIAEMEESDIRECISMMWAQKESIERGNFAGGADYDSNQYAHMMVIVLKLFLNKLKELEDIL